LKNQKGRSFAASLLVLQGRGFLALAPQVLEFGRENLAPAFTMEITSRQNPICKLARSLHSSKGRRERHLFLAEGENAVEAAIRNRWPMRVVLCEESEVLPLQEQATRAGLNTEIQTATPEVLKSISDAQTSPGVLALCEIPKPQTNLDFENCLLIADGVGDLGNIGTLIRGADAAGAGVLCAAGSANPFSPKAVRASAGSVFNAPPIILENNSTTEIIARLQAGSTPIITAAASAEISCFDFAWPQKCALVLGHETRGVSEEWESAATARVKIPMYGKAESLNVAMAGTLLLYAWRNAQNK
jgi:TrmH family RNA methyltransferase